MILFKQITLLLIFLGLLISAKAQDDFYPSQKKQEIEHTKVSEDSFSEDDYATATDYYIEGIAKKNEIEYNNKMGITDSTTYYKDEYGNVQITNNYYDGDNYDYNNEYYDYEYASRIKRFRRGTVNYGYYDDYYTNYYWYDHNPYNYGTSIYTSYNWWSPRSSALNVGWSLGWNWGWGYTGNYGYCNTGNNFGYHGMYGHHVSSYYQNGFGGYGNPNVYASNYYNSYDRNSHYYGKRGGSSSYSGYGGSRGRTSTSKGNSFGQKYEASVRKSSFNNNVRNTTTRAGGIQRSSKKNSYSTRNTGAINRNTIARTRTKSTYANPKMTRGGSRSTVNTSRNVYTSPKTRVGVSNRNTNPTRATKTVRSNSYNTRKATTRPNYSRTNPSRTTQQRSSYNQSRARVATPQRTTYSKPKSSVRSSYSKPSGSYNRSKTRTNTSRGARSGKATSVGNRRR